MIKEFTKHNKHGQQKEGNITSGIHNHKLYLYNAEGNSIAILLFNLLPSFKILSYSIRVTAVKAGIDLHIHNLFLTAHAPWIQQAH